ncbi:PREDICTED: putative vomeronasal receptor-like protein 4 [Chinchilla lanigera]|nr:PREDICTED: putative vomeronasal receptor-like protein 4 [Chinchilla lanigera]
MSWSNLIQRIIFLSLSGLGSIGNILIFIKHIHVFVMITEKRPIDSILIHLAFSNTIIICSTGIRGTTTIFYFRNFLGSVGCKIVIYFERVARGLSICTTCLLSVVQVVTISPRTILWRKFKPQTTGQVLLCLLLFWIFNFLISSNLLHYITAVRSMNQSGIRIYIGHCYMLPSRQIVRWIFLSFMAVRDLIFQSLMGWSSGYMAIRLYKHHKRVLYLYSSRFANNSSPEIRATQRILILMICFLYFYWADFIFSFYMGSILPDGSTTLNIKIFLVLGYAGVSPFVLMSRAVHVAKYRNAH